MLAYRRLCAGGLWCCGGGLWWAGLEKGGGSGSIGLAGGLNLLSSLVEETSGGRGDGGGTEGEEERWREARDGSAQLQDGAQKCPAHGCDWRCGTVRGATKRKGRLSRGTVVTEAVGSFVSDFGGSLGLDGAPQSRDLIASRSWLRKNRAPFLERTVVVHGTAAPAENKAGRRCAIHQSQLLISPMVSTFKINHGQQHLHSHIYVGEITGNNLTDMEGLELGQYSSQSRR